MNDAAINTESVRQFPLPYLVSFAPGTTGMCRPVVPGYGEAGWTVSMFASEEERRAFMRKYSHAWMPAWSRIG